jgi:purine-binding chemotaxis protein CheW
MQASPWRGGADEEEAAVEHSQFLTFTLGIDRFALGIGNIREIIRNTNLASVPLMPAQIRGVLNLRGAVVPVIDLAVLFERERIAINKRTSIIVIDIVDQGEPMEIGIMVDAVAAVIDIAPERIEPAPSFGAPVQSEFIDGIGKLDDGFVVILNAQATFALSKMVPAPEPSVEA